MDESLMFERENDGTAKVSLYGSDQGGTLDSLRTDPNRILWARKYEGYHQVDGVELPAAEADLINFTTLGLPDTATDHYEVYYHACNIDPGSDFVSLSIGHGVGGAAIVNAGWWSRVEPLPLQCQTGWRGPWVIAGDDTVRGSSAANDIAASFRIRRVDVGA